MNRGTPALPQESVQINVRLWAVKKGGFLMGRKTYAPEQIPNKLRDSEILFSQAATVGEASKKIGVTVLGLGATIGCFVASLHL